MPSPDRKTGHTRSIRQLFPLSIALPCALAICLAALFLPCCSPYSTEDWITESFSLDDAQGYSYIVYAFVPKDRSAALSYTIALDGDTCHGELEAEIASLVGNGAIRKRALFSIGYGKGLAEATRRRAIDYVPSVGGKAGRVRQLGDFIEKILVPSIEARYPWVSDSAADRILAGHSLGGLAVLCLALDRSSLASGYAALSPALWYGDMAILGIADSAKASGATLEGLSLFESVGGKETSSMLLTEEGTMDRLAALFPALSIRRETIEGAAHYAALVPAFSASQRWFDARP